MKIKEYIWEKYWKYREKFILKNGYNNKKYWEARGKFFHLEPHQVALNWQHKWIIDSLTCIQWDYLLEVGCGFGRNLELINSCFKNKVIYGIDISSTIVKKAKKLLSKKNIGIYEGSILEKKIFNEVDIVLCHGLLMHIKPEEIKIALRHISQLTSKYIICVEEIIPVMEGSTISYALNKFTFIHPYEKLFKENGWKIEVVVKDRNLGFWLLTK